MHAHTEVPAWTLADLRRPTVLASAIAVFLVSLALTQIASCNVHEISHALVGTAVGWEVDTISPCPGGAEVVYVRTTDAWYARVEGFAGGLGAAAAVAAVYGLVFVRGRRPLRGPRWWAAGLAVLSTIGAQLVIGTVEGVAGIRGWDYTETLDERRVVWIPVVGSAMLAFGSLHAWRWRAVSRSPGRTPPRA